MEIKCRDRYRDTAASQLSESDGEKREPSDRARSVRVAGIQGSLRYKHSDMPLYTDEESVAIAENMDAADILISHDSPKYLHSTNDYAHSGLQGITRYCEKYNVPLNIHGHHHENTKNILENGTTSICCYRVQIIDIKNL